MIDSNPSVFLVQEPTAEERVLGEQCGLHDGAAAVPFWMFAKVAVRLHRLATWAGDMEGFFRRVRRYVMAGVSAAAVNLSAVGIYWLHAHDARVAEIERAAAGERSISEYRRVTDDKIEQLRLDVRELRAALRRMSGADPSGSPRSDLFVLPDKLSLSDTKGHTLCSRLKPETLWPRSP